MRKVSLAVIASFAALAITTSVTGGAFDVGGQGNDNVGEITITKQIAGDQTPPAQWEFTITSENCGDSIVGPGGGLSSTTVTIDGSGGSTTVRAQDFQVAIGADIQCTYGVAETPVDGWTASPEAYTSVVVGETAGFVNTADTTTSSSSSTTSTTSTSVAPTTSGDETPTTTAAPQLPATGSDSNTQLALIAGAVLLAGIAATMASRRRPVS